MRLSRIAAAAVAALAISAGAAVAQASFTDAQLASYAAARTKVGAIAQTVQGQPTAEQQKQMSDAVTASGLTIEQFNAIANAASADPVLKARVAVAGATPSAAGSVGASVTDEELGKFAATMAKLRTIVPAGSTPNDAQKAEMNAAVQASGLSVERFNAIAVAISQDAHLRARVQLADAKRTAGS